MGPLSVDPTADGKEGRVDADTPDRRAEDPQRDRPGRFFKVGEILPVGDGPIDDMFPSRPPGFRPFQEFDQDFLVCRFGQEGNQQPADGRDVDRDQEDRAVRKLPAVGADQRPVRSFLPEEGSAKRNVKESEMIAVGGDRHIAAISLMALMRHQNQRIRKRRPVPAPISRIMLKLSLAL